MLLWRRRLGEQLGMLLRIGAFVRQRALRTARAVPFTQDGDVVRFEVPGVIDYEVVALS